MEPILCVKDCGFFGTAENRNMCSKCYKDFLKSCSENENVAKITQKLDGMAVKEEEKKKKNRCKSCNKKVGLLGFTCRCGELFCGLHRLPEGHACDFDYKSTNRSNPGLVEVKADKLEHRI